MRAVDLFCGTGGFSRGAHAAGFDVAGAYDNNAQLTFSYVRNFPGTKLFLKDISQLTGREILDDIGGGHVDVVFGGPPCQGFSAIGRRDANDTRRTLLSHFFRIVSELRPSAFVMENVEGLLYADAVQELIDAQASVAGYSLLKTKVLDASNFGAATKRKRAFVIGYDPVFCAPIDWTDFESAKRPAATVRQALAGLSSPEFEARDDLGFEVWRLTKWARLNEYAKQLASDTRLYTENAKTKHTAAVIERFSKLEEGAFDPIGKYPRLKWDGQCPTLRAGTGADRGSYQAVRPIHPDENRVITVREAARLQGFPDDHKFHPTTWHSFRQIGNSVSPIIATAILSVIHKKLEEGQLAQAAE